MKNSYRSYKSVIDGQKVRIHVIPPVYVPREDRPKVHGGQLIGSAGVAPSGGELIFAGLRTIPVIYRNQ